MNVLFIKNMMKANLSRITFKGNIFKRNIFTHNTFKVLVLSCSLVIFSPAQAAKKDLEQKVTKQREKSDYVIRQNQRLRNVIRASYDMNK